MTTAFIKGIENYTRKDGIPVIATIGTFDGIHRGHRAIFDRVKKQSIETSSRAVLITFHPHPRVMVSPENVPLLLTTIEEKGKFVPKFFDGKVLILDFNDKLRNMSAHEFVKDILVEKVGINKLIVGYDHAFGKNRSGDIPAMQSMGKEMGFEVEVVDPVMVKDKPVSSSRIRQAIKENRYREAIDLLGHDYAIYGIVEKGIGLGHKLGYPTANVNYNHRKLLPVEGVYSCYVEVDSECHDGMMFIGRNHFNPTDRISVEVNIFNFKQDIYDNEIIVYPTHFIRENRKFKATSKLVEQIEKDKINVIRIINEERKNGFDQRAESSNYF